MKREKAGSPKVKAGMKKQTEQMETQPNPARAKAAKIFFDSWINNNMAVFLMLVQYCKENVQREKQRSKLCQFLDSVEVYYREPRHPAVFNMTIKYLRGYLNSYPSVNPAQSERAIAMIRHLYLAMGLEHYFPGEHKGGALS